MRHHSTSIVGPDIDDSNHPATPDSCPPPAHPSVGERLGLVAFYADPGVRHGKNWEELSPEVRLSYTKVALAVRREVLAEGFADEDILAADTAFQASPGLDSRKWVETALSAALASRLARARTEGGGG